MLQAEGISVVGMLENTDAAACRQAYETLLCWVLVDPFQKHGFCRLELTVLMTSVSFGRKIFHIFTMLSGSMLANIFFRWYNVIGYLSVLLYLQCQPCRL